MASSIKLYTSGNMEEAVVDSATSEASGHDKEFLIDNNPDTWWTPTSTAQQTIEIDLQEAKTVDYVYFFVHNYKSLAAANYITYYSDNDADYYAYHAISALGAQYLAPHRYKACTLNTDPHRYMRIVLSSLGSPLPEISMIMFCLEYDVGQTDEWPQTDGDMFHNRIITGGGGRKHIIRLNRKSNKRMPRILKIPGTTNYNALRNAHQDSAGGALPLLLQEGDTYDDAFLVYFTNDDFLKNEQSYQYYGPEVIFTELPYIDSGESY